MTKNRCVISPRSKAVQNFKNNNNKRIKKKERKEKWYNGYFYSQHQDLQSKCDSFDYGLVRNDSLCVNEKCTKKVRISTPYHQLY